MPIIKLTNSIVNALLKSHSHLGGMSCTSLMKKYVYGRRKDKIHIFDIKKTWEKINIAARLIATIQPESIFVISTKTFGRKAVLKFCEFIGATPITGRFIPGSFSNYEIKGEKEPRLIITSDPFADKQAILEASHVNSPSISFVNTDNDLKFIDVAIPMNNRSPESIGTGFALLANVVRYMKGEINSVDENLRDTIEYFLYRDPDELEDLYNEQKEIVNENLNNEKTVIVDQE
ncbi:40S ribosomal protein S0 [Dictyocoela muelleri]|nr:40S ribosomal protein S0 [Dictyocoela muelleri]